MHVNHSLSPLQYPENLPNLKMKSSLQATGVSSLFSHIDLTQPPYPHPSDCPTQRPSCQWTADLRFEVTLGLVPRDINPAHDHLEHRFLTDGALSDTLRQFGMCCRDIRIVSLNQIDFPNTIKSERW